MIYLKSEIIIKPQKTIIMMKFITIKPAIIIGSLLVSVGTNLTSFTDPAQAFKTRFTISVPQDVVGFTRTFVDTLGRDLTGISLSSPEFPLTSFTGDGTDTLSANFFGATIPANTPFTLEINIADPSGTFSINNINTASVLTNGEEVTQIQTFSVGFICSTQGGGTPYIAIKIASGGNPRGFVQCQGDTIGRINPTNQAYTETLSVKPISGYQDFDTLGDFPPSQTVTIRPGVNLNVIQVNPVSVPEPSGTLGILASGVIGISYLLKGKGRKVA